MVAVPALGWQCREHYRDKQAGQSLGHSSTPRRWLLLWSTGSKLQTQSSDQSLKVENAAAKIPQLLHCEFFKEIVLRTGRARLRADGWDQDEQLTGIPCIVPWW